MVTRARGGEKLWSGKTVIGPNPPFKNVSRKLSRFVSSRVVGISGVARSHEQHTSQFPGGLGGSKNKITGRSLGCKIIWAIDLGGYYSDLVE